MARKVLAALFAVALVAVAVFALRLVVSGHGWRTPPEQDPPLAGWMTPRYVAMTWDVPPDVLARSLSLEKDGTGRRVTLAELAAARGEPVESLIGALQAAIDAHRAGG
jgi:hypothetical protein